jgi:UDP-N-acetylmuramate--alanine ligase
MDEFGPALGAADEIVLTDIYAASEAPIAGVTIDAFARRVRAATRAPVHVVAALADLPGFVASRARAGDLVITLGAGSIGTVGPRILDTLARGGGT